jgi:polyhydroxyalkanoate synthesis regulator phasin
MKAKTLLELVTLSSSLYTISKETHLMEKLTALSEQGKDKINDFMKESLVDADGNEIEFMDKLVLKAHQVKEELEAKIGEVVASFYEKVNIAHTDQLKGLELRMDQLSRDLALAEARINHLENKEK